MIDDSGPAFGSIGRDGGTDEPGLSIRDWFAGQTMIGLVQHFRSLEQLADASNMTDAAAKMAYQIADAMLAARTKGT